MKKFDKSNFLVILISPSGGGKTAILKEVVKQNKEIKYSISYTTRNIRSNEKNGKSYHFISTKEFEQMEQNGEFLESAKVHENYYGTSERLIRNILANHNNVIMDIDIQGAKQIINQDIDNITIFILPPSRDIWMDRLKGRGTESIEDIETRLTTAEAELSEIDNFQYFVINDDFKTAVKDVSNIIKAEEKKMSRYKNIKNDFNRSLNDKRKN